MPVDLTSLRNVLAADPGLALLPSDQRAEGLAAVATLTALMEDLLEAGHLNADGVISASDMVALSAAVQSDAGLLAAFTAAHGNDETETETGYHLLQGDGGSLIFQGRNLADKVADSIFHFGFQIVEGRFLNEDGAAGRAVPAAAGWLNYFVNGLNISYGSDGDDRLASGTYSAELASAANELWLAGAGNDRVSAMQGDDTVWAGSGADTVLGAEGQDLLHGEAGVDDLRGGDGGDQLWGDAGGDKLDGGAGDDLVDGGSEADQVRGGAGNDTLLGGTGADTIQAGEGADRITAGQGTDRIALAETVQACDVLVFAAGDSGTTLAAMDRVSGFVSGVDKIDLGAFGPMTLASLGFSGSGASCYYNGTVLRIDADGNGTCDMAIGFNGLAHLTADDFIWA